jgi:murein DD-endopeptidase MepM/ murein hydrolase activator NlpD
MKYNTQHIMLILFSLILISCSGPPVILQYGDRAPYGEWRHPAIDFEMFPGDPVIAASDGYVCSVVWHHNLGDNVIEMCQEDFDTIYAHLFDVFVRTGDYIKRGQLLGTVALAYPKPHLHFGVLKKFHKGAHLYSSTHNPHKFWLEGKPQCFDPKRDYSDVASKWLTLPCPCGEYKEVLVHELGERKKRE